MNILSKILMDKLEKVQTPKLTLAYEGATVGLSDVSAYACRNQCSGSCEGDCEGSCEGHCYGGCEDCCEEGCGSKSF